MRKNRFIFSLLVICLASQFIYSQSPAPQKTPDDEIVNPLELNKPVQHELAANEDHIYQVRLAADQYAAFTVEQRGIDVLIGVFGPDKKSIAQKDSIIKPEGPESLDFVALSPGIYYFQIRGKSNSNPKGHYQVTLTALRESSDKERRLEAARTLYNDGENLWRIGKYTEAKPKMETSLEMRQKNLPEDDLDVADSMGYLGLIVYALGDNDKALSLLAGALKIREKVLTMDHQVVARTIQNQATVYNDAGNYEKAEGLFEQAADIYKRALGPDSDELANTLGNLGAIYLNQANYEKAEQYTRQALDIKQRTLPPDSSEIAFSLSNLAAIYTARLDETKALELNKQAVDIWEKSLPPGHPDLARGLIKLATSYANMLDYKQAEVNYLRALDILRKAFGPAHPRIAVAEGFLAAMYHAAGDDARAEPLYLDNLDMMAKTIGKDHPDYATSLYNLAEFYSGKGEYIKAEPLYTESLSITEKILGKYHPNIITILKGEAGNYEEEGENTKALDCLTRAHTLREYYIESILFSNSERQKLAYINSLYAETYQFVSAHLKFAPDDPRALDLALTTIFERKGRVLDAMSSEFAVLRGHLNKDDQNLLDKYKETTARLAEMIFDEPSDPSETFLKNVKELEDRKESLETDISRKSAEFRSQIQPITVSAIRSAVPENGALIEFSQYRAFNPKDVADENAYGERHYVAYIVPQKGNIQWKDLGSADEIEKAIYAWRGALRDPKRDDVRQLGRALDEKLMQPIRSLAGNVKHLLISPDAFLNLIPFEALVDEQGHYLVENYSLTYLTSGRDLLRMQTARESKNKPLIMANPLFGEPKTGSVAAGRKNESITAARDISGTYFAPLTGTAEEARLIGDVFPEAQTLTGAQATKAALKKIAAPQILHIATHGFFLRDIDAAGISNSTARAARTGNIINKSENPLLRSGLALAGANQRLNAGDDGILTALEASGLDLWGTKLVVLSACDTGLGEVESGEGVYGLRRAFVLAGTESLVMSLWSVSDYVTRGLMNNYYKNLKQGMGRGEALRQVQLAMLKQTGRQHPFYWAGFIESGDWTNLDGK